MNRMLLEKLGRQLQAGDLSLEDFIHQAGAHPPNELAEVTLDLARADRCGYPEVIFAEGKESATLVQIVAQLIAARQKVLVTRISPEQASELLASYPSGIYQNRARTFRLEDHCESAERATTHAPVGVISAGTSDLPVAEEACETLAWMGIPVVSFNDVGVAGPHRLAERIDQLTGCAAVVVVAGMEGALPSVAGGYLACPVIAVPTSVGYGANLGGIAALLSMLNSCAANVTVVNIDAGFKGAYVAGLIASRSGTR